ncbi:isopenicillin N synthase family oxygenase [Romeria aff. gracilis LEGE 07310]|uniref:Isopenicillin N synthase family oxygenase n=1 Tax=Vasconcelosia minhoensis LEGE 07310 TaxID=915328 RepID=A0A8J7DPM1_9CYAN|nr:isopenicillin N synthase family oxygenase [Romeria gracilis]MBE9079925.1 isopenicillin N synthase family oxygenase [Romeria aff. gracilis LEGE 07310]
MSAQSISVLDLSDFTAGGVSREAFVRDLGEALQNLGFFVLVNHGVEQRLIDSAYSAAEAFFALSEPAKLRYELADSHGQRGFIRFGREHAKDQPAPDLKEFWHIGREPAAQPSTTDLINIWPKEVPQFRPVMQALYQQLEICATHLLAACARYLEQPSDFFAAQAQEGNTLLRVIHYPPIPPEVEPDRLRAAPHEDINLITLLCEATTPGLELLRPDGTWLPVAADPGQIVVDTGDMLQALSNGLLKSTTHRVANPANSRDRRFSMPFFVHPRPDFDLTPRPECVARTGGRVSFPTQTAGEYLGRRLAEIGLARE